MSKFKIGNKVRPKISLIKWYLSDEGQELFYPSSGILDSHQEKTLDNANIALLSLLMDNTLVGIVVNTHYINTQSENYKVLILDQTFNIEPKNLVRKYNV